MDRVYNVEKSRKWQATDTLEEEPPKKRGRLKRSSLMMRYNPLVQQRGDTSQELNITPFQRNGERKTSEGCLVAINEVYFLHVLKIHS